MAKYKIPISVFLREKEKAVREQKDARAKKFQETADRLLRGWDEHPAAK